MTKKPSKKERTLEPGISDEQYKLIGMMIAEWSRLELILGTLIWHFFQLEMEDGRIITRSLDARPKVRMLRQLAKRHIKPKATKTQVAELLDVVEGLQEDRNFIAHGVWGTAMPDNVPAASSIRPKSTADHVVTEAFPPDRMLKLIDLTRNIADVFHDLPETLAASQKKHDTRLRLLKTTLKPIPKGRIL